VFATLLPGGVPAPGLERRYRGVTEGHLVVGGDKVAQPLKP